MVFDAFEFKPIKFQTQRQREETFHVARVIIINRYEIFSSLTETVKMTTTKKMSIFVLQPNGSHSQWQGEKLNNVYQVSWSVNRDETQFVCG